MRHYKIKPARGRRTVENVIHDLTRAIDKDSPIYKKLVKLIQVKKKSTVSLLV